MKVDDKAPEEMQFHADMLRDVKTVLDNAGVYSVLSGSALLHGIRAGDFLPWQYGKVLIVFTDKIKPHENLIIERLKNKGFKITKYFKNRSNWKITASKTFFDKKFNIEIAGYFLQGKYYVRKCKSKYKAIPRKFLDRATETITLRGAEYNIPYKPEKYLKLLYGENWETPIKAFSGGKFRNKELYKNEKGLKDDR